MSPPDLNWENLRIFLMVMRSSSLREAAERLGVSHPTIRRRLDALEEELGVQLFTRHANGVHPTPEATELLAIAEQIEASFGSLRRRAKNVDPKMEGPIRITAPDMSICELLVPSLAAFNKRWPKIQLYIETSYELVDLNSQKADVAIRILQNNQMPNAELAGRKAATVYAAAYGQTHQWLGWWGDERDTTWIKASSFPDLPRLGGIQDIYLQRAACLAGMGLSMLPCFFAEPWLERRTDPEPAGDIWVLVHSDLRKNPRFRVFRDEIVAALKRLQPQLEGKVHKDLSHARSSDPPHFFR